MMLLMDVCCCVDVGGEGGVSQELSEAAPGFQEDVVFIQINIMPVFILVFNVCVGSAFLKTVSFRSCRGFEIISNEYIYIIELGHTLYAEAMPVCS
jgi:hypothetical protein